MVGGYEPWLQMASKAFFYRVIKSREAWVKETYNEEQSDKLYTVATRGFEYWPSKPEVITRSQGMVNTHFKNMARLWGEPSKSHLASRKKKKKNR